MSSLGSSSPTGTEAATSSDESTAAPSLGDEPLLYHDDNGVHAVNPDGTADTLLFSPASDDWTEGYRWSRDRTRIVSSTRRGIVIRDRDGTNEHVLPLGTRPALSPDGTRVAYVCPVGDYSGICVVRADGGPTTVLTPSDVAADTPDWSPDGTRIVYRRQHADYSQSLTVVDVASGALTDIVTTTGDQNKPEYLVGPRWSPTGEVISYEHKPADDVRYDLWVVGIDGRGAHEIVGDPKGIGVDAWSPDGARIALQPENFDMSRPTTPLIWTAAADGTNGSPVPGLAWAQGTVFDDW